jgi:hypothetical protein
VWLVVVHAFTFQPKPVPGVGDSSESPLWLRLPRGLNCIASGHKTQKEIPVSGGNVLSIDLPLRWVTTKENDMDDNEPRRAGRRSRRLAGALGLLLAGGVAGGALAATSSASAADTTTSTVAAPAATDPGHPADSATPVRPGEKALSGTDLATAKAAALKAVPGGTVYRVETDVDGATYEAHMTKADGTHVTVKLDKSFGVTSIQNGMGGGGPGGPAGGPAASPSGAAI